MIFRNPRIHTGRIRRQRALRVGAQRRPRAARGFVEAQRAEPDVVIDARAAEHFAEPAARHAALQFELPEAVLRMRIADREIRIGVAFRTDVRHAVFVAHERHRRGQSLRQQQAALRRQAVGQRAAQPQIADQQRENDKREQPRRQRKRRIAMGVAWNGNGDGIAKRRGVQPLGVLICDCTDDPARVSSSTASVRDETDARAGDMARSRDTNPVSTALLHKKLTAFLAGPETASRRY